MARVPELDQLAMKLLSDGRRIDEAVHVVHVYTVEAHPKLPDPTPYRNWTDDQLPDSGGGGTAYGDVGQPTTWEGRVANAARVLQRMTNDPLMLIDGIGADVPTNPVWCTYGTAPNAAFVIDRHGNIVLSQLWTDVGAIERTLRALVDPPEEDDEIHEP